MSVTEITPDVERDEDGLSVDAARIAAMLERDAAEPSVFDTAWRLYVCWDRFGRYGPLPRFSSDDEVKARGNAGFASLKGGVRYAVLFNGPSAWPAAVYVKGVELDDEAAEAAVFAGRS